MSSSMRWRSGLTDEQGAVRVGWDIGACSKMTVIHHAGSPARTRSTVHRRAAPALNLPEGPIPRSGFVLGRKAEGPVLRDPAIRRDVVWPRAERPLSGEPVVKADDIIRP